MPKQVLLIVDMLNDFIDNNGLLFCGSCVKEIVPFIQQEINNFRSNRDLIIYIKDSHEENDKEFERFPKHCIVKTWGSEIIKELKPEPQDKIVLKNRFSGFYKTELEKILYKAQPDNIKVAGVCTSICVMDTVGGLANRDYKITISKKCVSDFDQKSHDFALQRMEVVYGAVIVE